MHFQTIATIQKTVIKRSICFVENKAIPWPLQCIALCKSSSTYLSVVNSCCIRRNSKYGITKHPCDVLFVGRWPVPPKLLLKQWSDTYIHGHLSQVREEISDTLILSQVRQVSPPIRAVHRWIEGHKALQILSGTLKGGGHVWDRSDCRGWWVFCWMCQRADDIIDSRSIVSTVWNDGQGGLR